MLPRALEQLGAADPLLVGHSDGASIALIHAGRHPVAGIALLAPHVIVEDVTVRGDPRGARGLRRRRAARADGAPPRRPRRRVQRLVRRLARPRLPRVEPRGTTPRASPAPRCSSRAPTTPTGRWSSSTASRRACAGRYGGSSCRGATAPTSTPASRSSTRSYAGRVTQHDPDAPIAPMPSGAAVEYIRDSTGYRIHELSGTRVRATMALGEAHHQPFGVVHGGVYAIAVEGVASAGACAAVADRGMYAVGTNNNTDFLRPVTVAEVEVLAEPDLPGPHPAALGGVDHAPRGRQARRPRPPAAPEPAAARRLSGRLSRGARPRPARPGARASRAGGPGPRRRGARPRRSPASPPT